MTQIGGTRLVTLLVTLIATKFAWETDICDAAANQLIRNFDQSEFIIVVSYLEFRDIEIWPHLSPWVKILTFRLTFFRKKDSWYLFVYFDCCVDCALSEAFSDNKRSSAKKYHVVNLSWLAHAISNFEHLKIWRWIVESLLNFTSGLFLITSG